MKSDISTQYKRNDKILLYMGMAAGVAGAIWAWHRLSSNRPAPELRTWQKAIADHYGADEAARIAARVQGSYEELVAKMTPESSLALRWHLASNILPGLALYHALLEKHQNDREAALAEVESCFRAGMERQYKTMLSSLRLFPDPFRAFRKISSLYMRLLFPPRGWNIHWQQNDDQQVAFNIDRCYYLNKLITYGAPELTAVFCKNDDVMAEAFPASIAFRRTQTLGRGNELCDFRYCRSDF